MDKIKDDKYFLNRMLIYIDYINNYVSVINENNSNIKPNDQNSDGLIYKFIQLREESKNLSEEILINNPVLNSNIKSLINFRNRLTHDYDNLVYSYFDEIIEHDLPILKEEIEKILNK